MQGNLTTSTIAVGVLAILVGLVGAYAIRQGLMQGDETVEEPAAPEPVLVPLAITDLPKGRVIALADVSLTRMTREQIESRNLDVSRALMVPEQIIGRRLREDVRGGKPFNTDSLYLDGTGPDIADLLKPGFRAASIQVAYERGGAVKEGALVDVLFRSEARESTETLPAIPEQSISLIEGVEVLEVKPPQDERDRDVIGPTITLAVTPEDAQALQTVSGHGEITLVTRRLDELGAGSGDDALTLDELLGIEPPPLPPKPTPPWVTEVYYRTERGINAFPNEPVPAPAPTPAPNAGSDADANDQPGDKPEDAPIDIPALTIPGVDP